MCSGGGSTIGGSSVLGGMHGGTLMSTGLSSSTVGGPPGMMGNSGNNSHLTGPGSLVDPRAVSVVVTLPGPQGHGQALSDYGPI